MTRRLLIALALTSLAAPALADFFSGLTAFKRGDYEVAFREWEPLAERGDMEAQYHVARMYHHGYGVQDDTLAATWYRRAAQQGHAAAQNNLAVLFEQGRGVERDDGQAAVWYRKAANQGLAVAQTNLGVLYEQERGVDTDLKAAIGLYRRAAEQGHAAGQFRLAVLYEEGRGVAQDDDRAAAWYRRAAKQDHPEAQLALGNMHLDGRGVKRDPAKAGKWHRRAAAQGLDVPQRADSMAVAPLPPADRPTPPDVDTAPVPATDESTAVEAVAVSATGSSPPGASPASAGNAPPTASGIAPGPGADTPTPPVQAPATPPLPVPPRTLPAAPSVAPALAEIQTSADSGDPESHYQLGNRHSSGDGVAQSHVEAGEHYLSAAQLGHELAGYKVALQYWRGLGVSDKKDLVQAYYWFAVSAELGVGDAADWRDRLERKLSKQERLEAEQLIEAWRSQQEP